MTALFGCTFARSVDSSWSLVDVSRVDADKRPDLHRHVQCLARIAAVEPPRSAVSRSDVPNAFTIGMRPSAVTVVVTEGALEVLDGGEPDAVLTVSAIVTMAISAPFWLARFTPFLTLS